MSAVSLLTIRLPDECPVVILPKPESTPSPDLKGLEVGERLANLNLADVTLSPSSSLADKEVESIWKHRPEPTHDVPARVGAVFHAALLTPPPTSSRASSFSPSNGNHLDAAAVAFVSEAHEHVAAVKNNLSATTNISAAA